MDYIGLGKLKVSRFILGSNPFSGFSHQGTERDLAMKRYHTAENIKRTIREAEELGVNTIIARTDFHVMRLLMEYWDEGGQAQWFAQTCPEVGDHAVCVNRAASGGAKACHLHGGVMDFLLAQGRMGEIPPLIDLIRTLSRPVVHYKVLAAGRNDPAAAFAVVAGAMRPTDAVCVGVYTKDRPGMLKENVALLHSSLRAMGR